MVEVASANAPLLANKWMARSFRSLVLIPIVILLAFLSIDWLRDKKKKLS